MSRIVLLVGAVLVFVWLLRRALAGRKTEDGRKGPSSPEASVPELVACARCGVHLPRNEAVAEDETSAPAAGRFFCCEEHRRLGPG